MGVRRKRSHILFEPRAPAKITKMGNVIDLMVCDTITTEPVCKKISRDQYVNTQTGEVFEYRHIENRAQCYDSIRRTMKKIREIINCNVTNIRNIRWITLTYKENMTDSNRLYKDYEKFWKRLVYYFETNGIEKPEYITVIEPQGRGAWHVHGLLIWDGEAPYIENSTLAKIWGNGFVSVKQPKECDNLGAYFSAYLSNMTIDEIEKLPKKEQDKMFIAAAVTGATAVFDGVTEDNQSKKIIKGARLAMYPSGMNILRHSRGIKKPEVVRTTYDRAHAYLATAKETYYQSYEIVDEAGKCRNRIFKASYNLKPTSIKAKNKK